MGSASHDAIAIPLLGLLFAVLALGGVFVWCVRRLIKRSKQEAGHEKETRQDAIPCPPLQLRDPIRARPGCWLAIRHKNPLAVQSALSLHNSKPCSWAEGISGHRESRLFVSPPVSGWILVIGSALPDPAEDVDVCFRFLLDLSRKLGHVQFFSANTVLNHHAWAQVDAGRVIRAYAWAGRTLWNQGDPTLVEADLGMKCRGYTDAPESPAFGSSDPGPTNADKVHYLAARWSLDPGEVDERFIAHEWGVVGEPSRLF